ncbi:MAG: glycosyltransferase family 4 protein [bacterium]|nr:glycosyltransferase family 4 protein [bacterium]
MPRRIPVILAAGNILSGVTSWAIRLRRVLRDHPGYEILLLNMGGEPSGEFDFNVRNNDEACLVFYRMAPAVVVPNYHLGMYIAGLDDRLRMVGVCHSDSRKEYYDPLAWFEPLIATFIAVSPECAAKLAARIPSRAGDIAVVPCGVDVPEPCRREYRTAPIRLAYAGRVVQRYRRVFDFVPLMERLLARGVDFRFDIVGDGPDLAALAGRMEAVPHGGRVRFCGRVPPGEMAAVWEGHDVAVQVSEVEGTSVSMLEAMARGVVPVVTEASSGVRGVIADGASGFTVPVGAMDGMAAVIERLSREGDLLRRVGAAAHERAKRFSIELCAKQFIAVIERALAAKEPSWPYDRMPSRGLLIREVLRRASDADLAGTVRLRTLLRALGRKVARRVLRRPTPPAGAQHPPEEDHP